MKHPLRYYPGQRLTGVNASIAEAAYQAGFDTSSKEALMDLIWAVRRAAGHRISDSYRPNYAPIIGKKRPRTSEVAAVTSIATNRLKAAGKAATNPAVNRGTRLDPITLDDDDEVDRMEIDDDFEAANMSAKRQRQSYDTTNIHSSRRDILKAAFQELAQRKLNPTPAQPVALPTRVRFKLPQAKRDAAAILKDVVERLQGNSQRLYQTVGDLSSAWNADNRLRDVNFQPRLRALKQRLEDAEAAGAESIQYVNEMMGLINGSML